MEVVDKIKKFLSEGDQVYHKSYSSAVQYALDQAKKKGFTYDDDEYFSKLLNAHLERGVNLLYTEFKFLGNRDKLLAFLLEVK